MYLVKKIASLLSTQTGISFDDLVQVGSIGLIKAIDLYNPNRKTEFHINVLCHESAFIHCADRF